MKGIKRIFTFPAVMALMVIAGCSDDASDVASGSGFLDIVIEPQALAMQEDGPEVALTGFEMPDADDFTLTLSYEGGDYAHSWDAFRSFQQGGMYFSGNYVATSTYGMARMEGFDAPTYSGQVSFTVRDNLTCACTLRPLLVNSVISAEFSPEASDLKLMLQTAGGQDYVVTPSTDKLLFLNPGDVTASIVAESQSGGAIAIPAGVMAELKPGYFYKLSVEAVPDAQGVRTVTVTVENSSARKPLSLKLTPALLAATPAHVGLGGVTAGGCIELVEGDIPLHPVTATVTGVTAGTKLILTTTSRWLNECGVPVTLDLLHPSPALETALSLGLKVTLDGAKATADFTEFIGSLIYLTADDAVSEFSLKAVDENLVSSEPVRWGVRSVPAVITVTETPRAMAGLDRSMIMVETDTPRLAANIAIRLSDDGGATWTDSKIMDVTPRGDRTYEVDFTIPRGFAPLKAQILYCNEVRTTVEITRTMPEFDIKADAFATYAVLKIQAATAELTRIITENVELYVDGRRGSVLSRDGAEGLITIIGLTPDSRVTVTVPGDAGKEPLHTVTFTTETAAGIPNGDFEEFKTWTKYTDMPSGGRYAQYDVAIFNRQHTASFKINVPVKGWANVNEKTFCRSAKNRNTWYLQPSTFLVNVDEAYSGGYAVELVSTAWDADGEAIPDYLPDAPPYPDYSPIIPHISHRAAGKLFLGDYSFDAANTTEIYYEGIAWNSRPAALNGFYRYEPSEADRSDRAYVEIELTGTLPDGSETIIAVSRRHLPLATTYTSFSLPITYTQFGVKASRLKIMFSSSARPGDILHESATVLTMPDAVTATSLGSRLWLDKLEFSY